MIDAEKQARELILDIYDAALEPNQWQDVLRKSADFVSAMGALVFELTGLPDKRQLVFQSYSAGYDEIVMHDYLKHFHEEELHDQEVLAAHSKRTDDIQPIKDEVLAKSRAQSWKPIAMLQL